MIRKKKATPIIIGKAPSQREENAWYKRKGRNITEADKVANDMKGAKVASYLKVTYRARGGSRLVTQFWKTYDNGYMVCVDTSICKINIVLGFPAVRMLAASNKQEFNAALKKILKILSFGDDRADVRSETPEGFAKAVFEANSCISYPAYQLRTGNSDTKHIKAV